MQQSLAINQQQLIGPRGLLDVFYAGDIRMQTDTDPAGLAKIELVEFEVDHLSAVEHKEAAVASILVRHAE